MGYTVYICFIISLTAACKDLKVSMNGQFFSCWCGNDLKAVYYGCHISLEIVGRVTPKF